MKLLVKTLLTDTRFNTNPLIVKIISENIKDNPEESVDKLLMVISNIDPYGDNP